MKTSRKELLEWLKSLNISISKIEEIGQGSALCQLLSIIHPEVYFNFIKHPTSNYEYLKNLKTAQNFFQENNIEVRFPIEKLVLCKLQDNLEMAQWMYKYYENQSKKKKDINKPIYKEHNFIKTTNKEITNNFDEVLRERNRQEILDNLKKHYEENNIKLKDKYNQAIVENKKLLEKCKEQKEKINKLNEKLGIFVDNDIQKIFEELENNRDSYFLILVDVEKYLFNCKNIDENIKNDILNILYKN